MMLSVLICSLEKRYLEFHSICKNIFYQINKSNASDKVEIKSYVDNGEIPTGAKRNSLLSGAQGKYAVFVDDDDKLSDCYVEEILKAAETDCDAMAICGWMTTNGHSRVDWFISKDNPYCASHNEKGELIYLRYQNHISPIKTEIAKQFKFPEIYQGEDYAWATAIKNSGLIKTETKISKPIYHYDYRTVK